MKTNPRAGPDGGHPAQAPTSPPAGPTPRTMITSSGPATADGTAARPQTLIMDGAYPAQALRTAHPRDRSGRAARSFIPARPPPQPGPPAPPAPPRPPGSPARPARGPA